MVDLQSKLAEADNLLLSGQNREAANLLLAAVGAHPESPAAWDLLTLALIRVGEPEAATTTALRAVQLQPESATVQFNAGLASYKAGIPSREQFQQAARLNQVRPEPLLYLAAVSQGSEADAALQELAARFPSNPAVPLMRTSLAMSRGDLDSDGKLEIVNKSTTKFSLNNGATGLPYLEVSFNAADVGVQMGLIGQAGDRFMVINDPRTARYDLYHLRGHQLYPITSQELGHARFDLVTQELQVLVLERSTGTLTTLTYGWQGGALVELKRKVLTLEGDGSRKVGPRKDALDLFLAAQRERIFATTAVEAEVKELDRDKSGLTYYLLPAQNGYRIEVLNGTRGLVKARVVLNKDGMIEKLDWK